MLFDNRNAVIDFVENAYFGSVMHADIPAVLKCFHDDAEVLIRHGDNPVRRFSLHPGKGEANLGEFYTHLCGNFEAWFGHFKHFIDLEENGSACYFTVRLTPKETDDKELIGVQELHNCNFFRYEDGLIRHMIIYYSNTTAEAGDNTPTGYPQQL
jgi:hypothetical protein